MGNGAFEIERRSKVRFVMDWDMRYRVLLDNRIIATGSGKTLNISSAGVAFNSRTILEVGSFIELAIGWPALLNNSCRMQLIAFGRVLRSDGERTACSIEKYEFRTQGINTGVSAAILARSESMLREFAKNA